MHLSFKNMQLIINGKIPDKDDLINITNYGNKKYIDENNKYLYMFNVEFDADNEYLWIYAEYDYLHKRNKNVFNDSSNEEEPNPRKPNQIELKKQFFGMYYLKNNTLYITDTNRKKVLIDYLKSILNVEVNIKNQYKNIEEFSKAISSLKNIKFTVRPDLFQDEKGIYNHVNNIFGFDMAEYVKIDVNYNRLSFKDNKDKLIERVFQKQKNNQLGNLVVCGYDDNDVENIFDTQSYIMTVDIYIKADEDTGLYDQDKVKHTLLSKLSKVIKGEICV